MSFPRMEGLFAATVTPFDKEGNLLLDNIEPIVVHLERDGVAGLYICGSTGEGVSLRDDERRLVAEAYIRAARGRFKTFIQVGHNSLAAARELAKHAQQIGADAISATCPSYFKIDKVETLIDSMAYVAAGAPEMPFYYYHIPALTNVGVDMVQFMRLAANRIPTFAGLKFTSPAQHEFQSCLDFDGKRFDVLWGVDEMLLGALAVGARGAVGSTYNITAPIANRIFNACENGDFAEGRRLQSQLIDVIRALAGFPFQAALKQSLTWLGADCGACRLPLQNLMADDVGRLREKLEALGFFSWREQGNAAARPPASSNPAAIKAPHIPRPITKTVPGNVAR